MNWTPGPHAHYNVEFAQALARAHVSGRKTLRFRKHSYEVAKFLPGLVEDLKNKMYKLKVVY